jgi:hypothetical protein
VPAATRSKFESFVAGGSGLLLATSGLKAFSNSTVACFVISLTPFSFYRMTASVEEASSMPLKGHYVGLTGVTELALGLPDQLFLWSFH